MINPADIQVDLMDVIVKLLSRKPGGWQASLVFAGGSLKSNQGGKSDRSLKS